MTIGIFLLTGALALASSAWELLWLAVAVVGAITFERWVLRYLVATLKQAGHHIWRSITIPSSYLWNVLVYAVTRLQLGWPWLAKHLNSVWVSALRSVRATLARLWIQSQTWLLFVWGHAKIFAATLWRPLHSGRGYVWHAISIAVRHLTLGASISAKYLWLGPAIPFIYLGRALRFAARYIWQGLAIAARYLGAGASISAKYLWLGLSIPFIYLGRALRFAARHAWQAVGIAARYLGAWASISAKYLWLGLSIPFIYLGRALRFASRHVWQVVGIAARLLWAWASISAKYLWLGLAIPLIYLGWTLRISAYYVWQVLAIAAGYLGAWVSISVKYLWLGLAIPFIYLGWSLRFAAYYVLQGIAIAAGFLWLGVLAPFLYLGRVTALGSGYTRSGIKFAGIAFAKGFTSVGGYLLGPLAAYFAYGVLAVTVTVKYCLNTVSASSATLVRGVAIVYGPVVRGFGAGARGVNWQLVRVVTFIFAILGTAGGTITGLVFIGLWVYGGFFGGDGSRPLTLPRDTLTIAYSPEKEDLFLELVIGFNLTRPSGVPPVHAVRTDMVDMLPDAVNGRFGAISPDSSIWLDQLERMWQQKNPGAEPIVHSGTRYALSPIVIAMWSDTAAELGHPRQPVGWNDLLDKASRDARFRWSHSSVSTRSGLLSTTAEFYAGTGERRSLTQDDLTSKQTRNFVRNIEATVTRYGGESEDRVVTRLLAEGGRPLDAFVAQEQSVIYFNRNANYQNLVAIYPEEGTFWMDHPLVSLDGPWVSERQRLTIREFAAYITSPDAQISVLRAGYRPVDPSLSLESPISLIKPEYGADPAEPKRLLKVPSASLLENIREAWLTLKRPADIYLVVDVSGSMGKEKLTGTKEALLSFIEQIRGDRDRVALVPFSDGIGDVVPLGPSDSAALRENIAALEAGGGTELYQAVAYAYELIRSNTSDDRIGVILAMTDGKSDGEIATLESWAKRDEGSVMIFTVGYGKDADFDVLRRLSSLGAGQTYRSDPNTIRKLYMLIAANF